MLTAPLPPSIPDVQPPFRPSSLKNGVSICPGTGELCAKVAKVSSASAAYLSGQRDAPWFADASQLQPIAAFAQSQPLFSLASLAANSQLLPVTVAAAPAPVPASSAVFAQP